MKETERPEYVKCIKAEVGKDHPLFKKTWCLRKLEAFDYAFISVDHAAFNGMAKGRLIVCEECLKAVKDALSNGY